MFLIFDIEVVKDFSLFGLCEVRVAGLTVEFTSPQLNLLVFLLDKFDEVFIFVDEVGVLSE